MEMASSNGFVGFNNYNLFIPLVSFLFYNSAVSIDAIPTTGLTSYSHCGPYTV
jgi:hypothetical protein